MRRPSPELFSCSLRSTISVSMGSVAIASITAERTEVLGKLWSGSRESQLASTFSRPCRKNSSCMSTFLSLSVTSFSILSLWMAGCLILTHSRSCSVASSMRAKNVFTSSLISWSLRGVLSPLWLLLPNIVSTPPSSSSSASEATGEMSLASSCITGLHPSLGPTSSSPKILFRRSSFRTTDSGFIGTLCAKVRVSDIQCARWTFTMYDFSAAWAKWLVLLWTQLLSSYETPDLIWGFRTETTAKIEDEK